MDIDELRKKLETLKRNTPPGTPFTLGRRAGLNDALRLLDELSKIP